MVLFLKKLQVGHPERNAEGAQPEDDNFRILAGAGATVKRFFAV